jgi:hypothetical protein
LRVLDAHDVRYVVTGSVGALLHGVELQPGDLDVTPALDRANLTRLAAALDELGAVPGAPAGRWEGGRWIETGGEVPWPPDPEDPASFDTLLQTTHGALDVVPEVCGTYDELVARAVVVDGVRVASIDDLIATLSERAKHAGRADALRARR